VNIDILEIVGQPWLVLESFSKGGLRWSHQRFHGGRGKGKVSHS